MFAAHAGSVLFSGIRVIGRVRQIKKHVRMARRSLFAPASEIFSSQVAADFINTRRGIVAEVSRAFVYPSAEGSHAVGLRCDFVAIIVVENIGDVERVSPLSGSAYLDGVFGHSPSLVTR